MPETSLEAAADVARLGGIWHSDGSRHRSGQHVTEGAPRRPMLFVQPQQGRPTLRLAYLFSGASREASIAQHLKGMCEEVGIGLDVEEIDIHVGGSAHDLLDGEKQKSSWGALMRGSTTSRSCRWHAARGRELTGPIVLVHLRSEIVNIHGA